MAWESALGSLGAFTYTYSYTYVNVSKDPCVYTHSNWAGKHQGVMGGERQSRRAAGGRAGGERACAEMGQCEK